MENICHWTLNILKILNMTYLLYLMIWITNLDGWLIHSENYQALNTLKGKFREKVQCIYIDPPFNLGSNADYEYLVNYKDATWASLLENRLILAKSLLKDTGSIFVRCDYNGNWIVRNLLDNIFGGSNYRNEIKINRFQKSSKGLTNTTESLFLFSNSEDSKTSPITKQRQCIYCKSEVERQMAMVSFRRSK